MTEQTMITCSEEETETIAFDLARNCKPGTTLALHGDLGAGKTVFTRGFARGLGIEEAVTSPTFTIVQEYGYGPGLFLFHLDLYRIPDTDAAFDSGLDEFLDCPFAITVIEWPARISEILPSATVHIFLEHQGEDRRLIRIGAR